MIENSMFKEILAALDRINTLCPDLKFNQVISSAVPKDVAQRLNNDLACMPQVEMLEYLLNLEAKIRKMQLVQEALFITTEETT